MRNKTLTAKLSAFALFLSAVISGPAFGTTQNSEFGRDWSQVSSDYSEDVATSNNGAIVYNLSSPNIYRSSDYGTTWVDVTNQYQPGADVSNRNIAVSGDGSVIVITEYCGFAWISKNSGESWELIDQGYNCWIEPLVSQNGQRIMIYAGSYIFSSDDYGSSFSPSRIPWGWESWTSSMSDSGQKILVIFNYGSETKIYMSQDYGASFSRVSIPELVFPGGVAVSGDGRYLIASDYVLGGVWVSSDTAASWTKAVITSENSYDYLGPQFTISNDGSRIVQTNYKGSILVSDDFGATFTEVNQVTPQFGLWRNAKMNSDGSIIYIASGAGVYKSVFTHQSSGLFNSGTVTFTNICPTDTSIVTSVQAQSVLLIIDTLTVASDTNEYHYYTETNTALWGAAYDYGSTQQVDCTYLDMTGNVLIARGPFIASSGTAYSETTTANNTDLVQYVGNIDFGFTDPRDASISSDFDGTSNNCGNLTVPNLNVANSCDFLDGDKQRYWPTLSIGSSLLWRVGAITSATAPIRNGTVNTVEHPAVAFVIVKAKKTVIAAAPRNTSWVATETFTVTSA